MLTATGKEVWGPAMVVSSPSARTPGKLEYVAAIDGSGGGNIPGVQQHVGWIKEALQVWRQTGRTDWTARSVGGGPVSFNQSAQPQAPQVQWQSAPQQQLFQPQRFVAPAVRFRTRGGGGCSS